LADNSELENPYLRRNSDDIVLENRKKGGLVKKFKTFAKGKSGSLSDRSNVELEDLNHKKKLTNQSKLPKKEFKNEKSQLSQYLENLTPNTEEAKSSEIPKCPTFGIEDLDDVVRISPASKNIIEK